MYLYTHKCKYSIDSNGNFTCIPSKPQLRNSSSAQIAHGHHGDPGLINKIENDCIVRSNPNSKKDLEYHQSLRGISRSPPVSNFVNLGDVILSSSERARIDFNQLDTFQLRSGNKIPLSFLLGFQGFLYWIVIIPNRLGNIIHYNHQPTEVLNTDQL